MRGETFWGTETSLCAAPPARPGPRRYLFPGNFWLFSLLRPLRGTFSAQEPSWGAVVPGFFCPPPATVGRLCGGEEPRGSSGFWRSACKIVWLRDVVGPGGESSSETRGFARGFLGFGFFSWGEATNNPAWEVGWSRRVLGRRGGFRTAPLLVP